MPRPAVAAGVKDDVKAFIKAFILKEPFNDDFILPKKDRFSPFDVFVSVFPELVNPSCGGSSPHGISQAAFNKVMTRDLEFVDAMRNPYRNTDASGTRGISSLCSRYYLRCRWATEAEAEKGISLLPHNKAVSLQAALHAARSSALSFGSAGRGGDRTKARRSGSPLLPSFTSSSQPSPTSAENAKVAAKERNGGQSSPSLCLLATAASCLQSTTAPPSPSIECSSSSIMNISMLCSSDEPHDASTPPPEPAARHSFSFSNNKNEKDESDRPHKRTRFEGHGSQETIVEASPPRLAWLATHVPMAHRSHDTTVLSCAVEQAKAQVSDHVFERSQCHEPMGQAFGKTALDMTFWANVVMALTRETAATSHNACNHLVSKPANRFSLGQSSVPCSAWMR